MTVKRERALFCALAVVLVLVRSFVAGYYEGFYFDSDQAIVGLMARHLSRFHTFPLFLQYVNDTQAYPAAALTLLSFGITWAAMLSLLFVGGRRRATQPVAAVR